MSPVLLKDFIVLRRAELSHGCYTVFGWIYSSGPSCDQIWKANGITDGLYGLETSALREYISSMSSGEVDLKEEGNQTAWSAVFNSSAVHAYEKDWNKCVVTYTSINQILLKHIGDRESNRVG